MKNQGLIKLLKPQSHLLSMTAILFPGAKVLLLGNYLSRHQTSHQFGMTFRGFCQCMLRIFADFRVCEVGQSEINVLLTNCYCNHNLLADVNGTYFSVRQDDYFPKIRGIRVISLSSTLAW